MGVWVWMQLCVVVLCCWWFHFFKLYHTATIKVSVYASPPFSCCRERCLECPSQSQVKPLCIRLSNAITIVWHSSSSRMVSVFWLICVSRSEPHTNVDSDAPHDLITMWQHGHSPHRCIARFHDLASWCMQSCSSMVWVIDWQCSSIYLVHIHMFTCISHACHFLIKTYSQSV